MAGRSGLETIRRYGVGTGSQKTAAYFVNVNGGLWERRNLRRTYEAINGVPERQRKGRHRKTPSSVPVYHWRRGEVGHPRRIREVKPELGRFRIVGILRRQDRSCKEITCSKSGVLDEVLQYQTKFFDRMAWLCGRRKGSRTALHTWRLPRVLLRGRDRPFQNDGPYGRFTHYRKGREELCYYKILHAAGTLQSGDQRRKCSVQHFWTARLLENIRRTSGGLQRRV